MFNDLEELSRSPSAVLLPERVEEPWAGQTSAGTPSRKAPWRVLQRGGGERLHKSLIREMKRLRKCFRIELSCVRHCPGKGSSVMGRAEEGSVWNMKIPACVVMTTAERAARLLRCETRG